ncbi:MAG: hypothetical protein ACRYG7_08800 [Janthinobacterium lividum]
MTADNSSFQVQMGCTDGTAYFEILPRFNNATLNFDNNHVPSGLCSTAGGPVNTSLGFRWVAANATTW